MRESAALLPLFADIPALGTDSVVSIVDNIYIVDQGMINFKS